MRKAHLLVVGYLLLAAAMLAASPVLADGRWVALHLLLLGAVSNAIVLWSEHFTLALLQAPPPPARLSLGRLVALNAGVVTVLGGIAHELPAAVAVGAGLVLAAIAAHLGWIVTASRRALQRRWIVVIRFYVAAGIALLVGGTLGALLGTGALPMTAHVEVRLAHIMVNLFGWVGLAVLGTLFTLWPTVLRARMVDGVVPAARRTLVLTVAGLAVAVPSAAFGVRLGVGAGLLVYAAGVAAALDPFLRTLRVKAPHSAASWMLAAATSWFAVAVGTLAVRALVGPDIAAVSRALDSLLPVLVAGFVAQTLLGALTFLLPVVLGGGPHGNRRLTGILETVWVPRVVVANVAVALVSLPVPDALQFGGWVLLAMFLVSFVVLAAIALLTRRHGTSPERLGSERWIGPVLAAWAAGLLAVVGTGVALGAGEDAAPAAGGHSHSHGTAAAGPTQTVRVELRDVVISPSSITVAAGTNLVLDVVNTGSLRHDFVVPDGPRTRLLGHNESQRLDLGVIDASFTAWCSVSGHRAAGMELAVTVGDVPAAAAHSMTTSSDEPGPDWKPYDARLQPAPGGTHHRVSLRVEEKALEIAPGVTQTMWTFGGTVPGPVLRGKVGDLFTVTLVNGGTVGHSLDFHAGAALPAREMRTIDPGESLVYQFRADYAGAWLYHCGTPPVLHHLGNGMYGALIVDPPDLPKVDAEYVLVQSELFYGKGGDVGELAKMRADEPDAVAFNGYAGQYDHAPIEVRAGQRIRTWVVDAGPQRSSSFHVIGSRFDTVFKEGAYLLRRGNAERGGAQVLDLGAAQGGFVEFVLAEPGRYPFVTHAFADATAGAAGAFTAR